jgi:hypothetical protein
MAGATNIFSYSLTNGSMSISAFQNVQKVSILTKQGVSTFIGNSTFNGLASQTVTFAVGQGITLSALNAGSPLDGVIIGAPTGSDVVDIVISYQ